MRTLMVLTALLWFSLAQASSLDAILVSEHRSDEERARDRHRHPVETLQFFDVQDDMTVVEIWPGARGWYTAILAPYLREKGTFYAAQFPPDSDISFYTRALPLFKARLAEQSAIYDQVRITHLYPPIYSDIAPAGTVDRVLTFRNVHNWAKSGKTEAVFASLFKALKPGGILGVVEHRAPEGRSLEAQIESGYMTESYVIAQAEKAGFRFAEQSEVNANPQDDADHPAGVWTLPPTLRLGDQERATYQAIGESDRMTLKFIKPE